MLLSGGDVCKKKDCNKREVSQAVQEMHAQWRLQTDAPCSFSFCLVFKPFQKKLCIYLEQVMSRVLSLVAWLGSCVLIAYALIGTL